MSKIPSWAKVGARVACVQQIVVPPNEPTPAPPVPDKVYTISAVRMFGRRPSIQLVEIEPLGIGLTADGRYWENNSWWGLKAFRPVTEPKSDAEIEAELYHKLSLKRLDRIGKKLNKPEKVK